MNLVNRYLSIILRTKADSKINQMNKIFIFFYIFLPVILNAQNDTLSISSRFGEFTDASSITASRGEYIYVSDIGLNKIFKYNAEGKLLAEFGGTGIGRSGLNQPVSIDATNGLDIFICDYLNNRIVRLDDKLNLISIFDFNSYNSGVQSSKKIYNPKSVTSISTGELLLLCEAGNFNAIRIREFSDINLYFGQFYDGIIDPFKIVKGNSLDVWILEKSSNDLLNFNNLGIFVKRLKLPESLKPISIAYAEQYIVVLFNEKIMYYDIVKGVYTVVYYLPKLNFLTDVVLLDKETLFVLHKNEVLKFIIK